MRHVRKDLWVSSNRQKLPAMGQLKLLPSSAVACARLLKRSSQKYTTYQMLSKCNGYLGVVQPIKASFGPQTFATAAKTVTLQESGISLHMAMMRSILKIAANTVTVQHVRWCA